MYDVPKALVSVRAAKEIRDDIDGPARGPLRRQAEDTDSIEEWEDVRREDLVKEHRGEGSPEQL